MPDDDTSAIAGKKRRGKLEKRSWNARRSFSVEGSLSKDQRTM